MSNGLRATQPGLSLRFLQFGTIGDAKPPDTHTLTKMSNGQS